MGLRAPRPVVLYALLMSILPLLWLTAIFSLELALPIQDQIDTPGHIIEKHATEQPVLLSDFVRWHNESRQLIPNLVFFGLYRLTGAWQPQIEMAVGIAFGALNCLLATLIARAMLMAQRPEPTHRHLLAGLVFCTYYFAIFGHFRWLNGITLHRLLPDTMLLLGVLAYLTPRIGVG